MEHLAFTKLNMNCKQITALGGLYNVLKGAYAERHLLHTVCMQV